jgi:uncharacterized coiled-coil protein SlyX
MKSFSDKPTWIQANPNSARSPCQPQAGRIVLTAMSDPAAESLERFAARLTALEEAVAYNQRTLDALDESLRYFQRRLNTLETGLSVLGKQLGIVTESLAETPRPRQAEGPAARDA